MTTDSRVILVGTFAIPNLVGRENILKPILERIQNKGKKQPCIIFLSGPGGIGKTRLLLEISDRCKNISDINISDRERLVDVYHLLYHTPYEMTQAIYESLMPIQEPFHTYEDDARKLNHLILTGEAEKIEKQTEKVLRSFIIGLKVVANKQRVVILLDTVERFVYGVGEEITGIPHIAKSWRWLVKELASLTNTVIVMAGRSPAAPLFHDLLPPIETIPINVDAFSLKESKEYFDAAAWMALQNKAEDVAKILVSLSPEEKELAHKLAGGRPIMLSLIADYVSSGGLLSPLFDELQGETGEKLTELARVRIMERLLSVEQLGEVFRCMSLMPKGADSKLFAAVMGISEENARKNLVKFEKYSFVKVRRYAQKDRKDTYFLHDELYDMIKQAAFTGPRGYDEKRTIYRRVIDWYEEQFSTVRMQLADFFSSIQIGGNIDYAVLNSLQAQRTEILLALLYYRLRENPPKGHRRWIRYDHEATIIGDPLLNNQLQLELVTYLGEIAEGKEKEMPGWDESLVRWSMLLNPVKHAWALGESKTVLEKIQELEDAYPSELSNPLKKAMLSVWKAYALISSQPAAALDELDIVISELTTDREIQLDRKLHWLTRMILAFAYRVRGYAYRVQWLIEDAIKDQRQAAVLLREVDLKIEMATVNNDLGFALALHGEWANARTLVLDALNIRRDLGLGMQIAYSLNTLATIDVYEGRYPEAIVSANSALNLFRAVEHDRGRGLSLIALAEATRRQNMTFSKEDVQARIDRLNRAYEMADEALMIFNKIGERSRQVEALIEKGCARRDAVRCLNESAIPQFSREKWIKESQRSLESAAKIAQKAGILYRRVDALVNLAWLGYYAGNELGEFIQSETEKQAEKILKEYNLQKGYPKPKIYGKPEYQPLLSTQLGKLHILRGHQTYTRHLDAWQERIEDAQPVDEILQNLYHQLAQEYFLGLENSSLYSPEYRDLRLVKQQIFNNLKTFRQPNLTLFMKCVEELESYYNAPKSQLRQLLVKMALLEE